TRRWPSRCSWRPSTCGSGGANNAPLHATPAAHEPRDGRPVRACRLAEGTGASQNPAVHHRRDRMPRTHKAALPLLAAALGTALAACGGNPQEPAATVATPATAEVQTPAVSASDAVHAFGIGPLQATALRDGSLSVPNDNAVFGVGLTPDQVSAVLSGASLDID